MNNSVHLLTSDRFELRAELGRGATGVVYEAYDRKHRSVVALKCLTDLDPDALLRFKREFRALADLAHPNMVRLGELHAEGRRWFFTMERIEGEDIVRFVRGEPGASYERSATDSRHRTWTESEAPPPLTASALALPPPGGPSQSGRYPRPGPIDSALLDRLTRAMRQLAEALEALHRCGRVHRDVKPSNVLVEKGGRVVLLDFGLADEVGSFWSYGEAFAGTPAYIAPEAAKGEGTGPAADWYSFGVVLFELLTGRLPFEGSAAEMLHARTEGRAPPIRSLSWGAPDTIYDLCDALLDRDPAARPIGREILACFGVHRLEPVRTDRPPAEGPSDLIGRESELSVLRVLLDQIGEGRPKVAIVEGEPGIGKTALVHRFLSRLKDPSSGVLVLDGRCYQQESVPLRAVDALVDALSMYLDELPPADALPLLGEGVEAVLQLFPVLGRVGHLGLDSGSAREPPTDTDRRAQATRELKALLREVGRRTRVVLAVDDVQWADPESLAMLRALVAGPDAPRCLLLVTVRDVRSAPSQVGRMLDPGRASLARIPLRGLEHEDAEHLFALHSRGRGPSTAAERRLLRETEGHPLQVTELARLRDHLHEEPGTQLHLEDVLLRRIRALEAWPKSLLEVACLVGVPVRAEVLADAAGLEGTEAARVLDTLRRGRFIQVRIEEGQRVVEPYHDRVREAVLAELALENSAEREAAKAQIHLQIARSLVSHTTDRDLATEVFRIVRHFDRAVDLMDGPAERRALSVFHLEAGRRARLSTAHDRALEHFDRAEALLCSDPEADDDPLHVAVAFERMETLYMAGRAIDGIRLYEQLSRRLESPSDRGELHARRIVLSTLRGDFRDAIATGKKALAELGTPLPGGARRLGILREYARLRWSLRGRRPAELLALPRMEDETLRANTRILMAMTPVAFFHDTELLSVVLLRVARLSVDHGLTEGSAYAFAGLGGLLSGAFGRYREAAEFGEVASRIESELTDGSERAKVCFLRGTYVTPWVRPFSEAKAQLREALDAGRRVGDPVYEAYAAATLSVITLNEGGRLDEMQATAERCREIARKREDADMSAMIEAHLRYYLAHRGLGPRPDRLSRPSSSDRELADGLTDRRTPLARFYYHLLSAELELWYGDLEAASLHLAACEERRGAIFGVPTAAELELVHALTAHERMDRAGLLERRIARARLKKSVAALSEWAASCPENFGAHAAIAKAEEAWVSGRPKRARKHYEDAIHLARRGCSPAREALARSRLAALLLRTDGRDAEAARVDAQDALTRWGAVHTPRWLPSLDDESFSAPSGESTTNP